MSLQNRHSYVDDTDPVSMGIPGEFDHPRLADAYARVSAAAAKVSVDGRLLSVGIGGLKWVFTIYDPVLS